MDIPRGMDANPPVTRMPRELLTTSAATRIPQELFSQIISNIPSDHCFGRKKRYYGRLSLVCRYWASKMRGHIFAKLILSSRNDALEFIALAKCSIWTKHSILPIGKHVESIHFEVDVRDLSWIHLILHCMPNDLLGPTGDSTIEISLYFECLASDRKDGAVLVPAPKHVYHDLPRRFPPMMRPRFTQPLVLIKRLIFGNPNNLAYFSFSAHRRLKLLWCDSNKFTDIDTLSNVNFNGKAHQMGKISEYLDMDPCADGLITFMNIMLTHRVCAMSSPPLNYAQTQHHIAPELDAMSTVLRSLSGVGRTAVNGMPDGAWREVRVNFDEGKHCCNIN